MYINDKLTKHENDIRFLLAIFEWPNVQKEVL